MSWLLLALVHGGPLDYATPDMWLRSPDTDRGSVSISVAGQLQPPPPPDAQDVDCFYVYPTVDLRLQPGQHEDLSDLDDAARMTRWQAQSLAQACTLWVPKYRQATIASFGPKGVPYVEAAYVDVLAAFQVFAQASDRPFVLIGHSQGSVHLSRLIEEEVSQDPALMDRLVVAWLPGSPSPITDSVPACEDSTSRGCTVQFRSFREGNKVPSFGVQSPAGACQNPAAWTGQAPSEEGWLPLTQALLPNVAPWKHADAHPEGELVSYTSFEARCATNRRGDSGLELRWTGEGPNPIPCLHPQSAGSLGTHVLDLAVVQGDLVADIRRRTR